MKKLDGELFWMLFSMLLVLVILYMAYDWKNSVATATGSLNYSECLKMVYGSYWNLSDYDVHGSYILRNSTDRLNQTR
jgi:hypothetical protein